MINFHRGPAQGVSLPLRRAPVFLRVTRKTKPNGNVVFDALDLLDDTPEPEEKIFVYHRVGEGAAVHIDRVEGGRRRVSWMAMAEYVYHENQPADFILRDGEHWRDWALDEHERLTSKS